MATEELVKVHPMALREGFESKRYVQVTNLTPRVVAFMVETNDDRYTVRENDVIFSAGSTIEIEITANKAPCNSIGCSTSFIKFQCVVASCLYDGMTFCYMFVGMAVQEVKLRLMHLF